MDELKKQSKLSSYFTEVRRVESTRDMDFSHTDPFLEEKATQQFGLPKVEESPAKVRSKTSSHQNSKNNAMTFMQKLTLCRLDAMWTRRQVFAWAFKKHGCGESTIRNVLDSGEKFFHKLVIEGHADQYRIRPSTAYGVALASVDLELRALHSDNYGITNQMVLEKIYEKTGINNACSLQERYAFFIRYFAWCWRRA